MGRPLTVRGTSSFKRDWAAHRLTVTMKQVPPNNSALALLSVLLLVPGGSLAAYGALAEWQPAVVVGAGLAFASLIPAVLTSYRADKSAAKFRVICTSRELKLGELSSPLRGIKSVHLEVRGKKGRALVLRTRRGGTLQTPALQSSKKQLQWLASVIEEAAAAAREQPEGVAEVPAALKQLLSARARAPE